MLLIDFETYYDSEYSLTKRRTIMSDYTPEQLAEILEKHRLWLGDEEGGERANLGDANLCGAYLVCANLRGADLRGATLREANLRDANLRGASLVGANLRGAYLRDANLRDANLEGANLRDADLRDADLRDANLEGANLGGADLRGANLGGIRSLWGTVGDMRFIKSIQADIWPVTYTATHMQIGCQLHRIDEWWAFGDAEINEMDPQALEWWKVWKPILRQIIETSPAIPGREAP